jgi:hypothetical protein
MFEKPVAPVVQEPAPVYEFNYDSLLGLDVLDDLEDPQPIDGVDTAGDAHSGQSFILSSKSSLAFATLFECWKTRMLDFEDASPALTSFVRPK